MEELMNDVIEERIKDNLRDLHSSKKWRSHYQEYRNLYSIVFETTDGKLKKQLEDMLSLKDYLDSENIYLVYKIGFVDGINLDNQLEKSR